MLYRCLSYSLQKCIQQLLRCHLSLLESDPSIGVESVLFPDLSVLFLFRGTDHCIADGLVGISLRTNGYLESEMFISNHCS